MLSNTAMFALVAMMGAVGSTPLHSLLPASGNICKDLVSSSYHCPHSPVLVRPPLIVRPRHIVRPLPIQPALKPLPAYMPFKYIPFLQRLLKLFTKTVGLPATPKTGLVVSKIVKPSVLPAHIELPGVLHSVHSGISRASVLPHEVIYETPHTTHVSTTSTGSECPLAALLKSSALSSHH